VAELDRALRLERAFAVKELAEVQTIDVGHRDMQEPVRLPRAPDRDDSRVVEPCYDLRLAQEPCPEALVACQLRRHELERHGGPVYGACEVDRAGRALSEQGLDAIAGDHGARCMPEPSLPAPLLRC